MCLTGWLCRQWSIAIATETIATRTGTLLQLLLRDQRWDFKFVRFGIYHKSMKNINFVRYFNCSDSELRKLKTYQFCKILLNFSDFEFIAGAWKYINQFIWICQVSNLKLRTWKNISRSLILPPAFSSLDCLLLALFDIF